MIIWPHDLIVRPRGYRLDRLGGMLISHGFPPRVRGVCDTCGSETFEMMALIFQEDWEAPFDLMGDWRVCTVSLDTYFAVFGECGHVRSTWMREITKTNEPIFSVKLVEEVIDDPPGSMRAAFARLDDAVRSLGRQIFRVLPGRVIH